MKFTNLKGTTCISSDGRSISSVFRLFQINGKEKICNEITIYNIKLVCNFHKRSSKRFQRNKIDISQPFKNEDFYIDSKLCLPSNTVLMN